jgi:hypothetical protein
VDGVPTTLAAWDITTNSQGWCMYQNKLFIDACFSYSLSL